jgi:hypothetical protein
MAFMEYLLEGMGIIQNVSEACVQTSFFNLQVSSHVCYPQSVSPIVKRSLLVKLEELFSGTVRFVGQNVSLQITTNRCQICLSFTLRSERVMCYFLEPDSGLAVLSEKDFTIQVS